MFEYKAIVRKVYDGDSVTLDIDLGCFVWKHSEKCRLYGINTPEVRGKERPQGLVSRDVLREILPLGSTITVKTYLDKTGKYGRLLADIYVDHVPNSALRMLDHDSLESVSIFDGDETINVNQWLVEAGLGVYAKY